ncbi:MAG: VCBS repeat-containing protein, partial [Fretibacterium sp.]|nr:VCBS repeat-containing protein [Fretibacterium sp.]
MLKKKLAASVLALLALFASAAGAGVTINGKPLDEVDDIMAETGAAKGYPKESLLIFRADNTNQKYLGTVVTLDSEGKVCDKPCQPSLQPNPSSFIPNWNGGLYPVSTASGTDCRRRVWVPTAMNTDTGTRFQVPGFSFDGPVTSSDWKGLSGLSDDDAAMNNAVVTDAKSGFFPSGGGEVLVVGLAQDIQTSKARGSVVFLADGEGAPKKLNHNIKDLEDRYFHDDSAFPSCRVAVGDFDGDGRADEVAMLYNDKGGSDEPYYIRVYKVSRSGDTLNGGQMGGDGNKGRLSSKANFHYRTEASALLTGDFDGDGRDELALVASDKDDYLIDDPNRSYISVEIFKWNGSGWDRGYKSASSDSHYQLANGGHGTEYRTWGLQAAAGDLDGDGKDEIVTLAIHGQDYNRGTAFLSAWGCDQGTLTPKTLGFFDISEAKLEMSKIGMEDNSDAAYWEQRLLSLAVGPFTGQVQGINSVCDVALSMAGPRNPTDHGDASKQRVWVAKTVLENGTFKGFGTPVMVFSDDVEGTVGLAASDFAGETLRLGTPEHVKVEGHKNYTVILRVPPYHVDWIQAPWSDTVPTGPTNFSWMGRTVQYETSEQEGTETLVTSRTQNYFEAGLDFKYDAALSVGITMGKVKNGATGLFNLGVKYGLSAGVDGGMSWTKETADKDAETHTLSTQLKATTADALMYDAADYHIWRYPVVQPAPAWMTASFKNNENADLEKKADGNIFVTYTLCDEATQHICDSGSSQYDGYEPSYEEGNLFSYPNRIFSTEGEMPQKELSSETSFTLTTDTQQTLSFTKSGSSTEKDSTSWKVHATGDLHGSINGGASIKVFSGQGGYSLKLYGQYGHEAGDGTTSTKTWSNSEKVVIGANTDNLYFNRDYAQ